MKSRKNFPAKKIDRNFFPHNYITEPKNINMSRITFDEFQCETAIKNANDKYILQGDDGTQVVVVGAYNQNVSALPDWKKKRGHDKALHTLGATRMRERLRQKLEQRNQTNNQQTPTAPTKPHD
jgi:hypothetical protein